jgi:hypothetical protein
VAKLLDGSVRINDLLRCPEVTSIAASARAVVSPAEHTSGGFSAIRTGPRGQGRSLDVLDVLIDHNEVVLGISSVLHG